MVAAPPLGGGLRAWHQRFVLLCDPTAFLVVPAALPTTVPPSELPDSIDSAVLRLSCFGCVFTGDSVSIAEGHYAVIDYESDSVLELFLVRPQGNHFLVAKISASTSILPLVSQFVEERESFVILRAGSSPVHNPDTLWFVSSQFLLNPKQ